MPRTSSLASTPAARCFSPDLNSASAKMVAVVVPSPASSEVLEAASLTSWAPMFSTLLRNSSSSATVTPSLVTVGPPQDLSSTAFRPRGPSVDFTARASFSTPASNAWRAFASKTNSLTAIWLFSWCWVRNRITHGGGSKDGPCQPPAAGQPGSGPKVISKPAPALSRGWKGPNRLPWGFEGQWTATAPAGG